MMRNAVQALETTGNIDRNGELHLDEPVNSLPAGRVRVILLLPDSAESEDEEWLQAEATNPAFDFLKDPEEDIYTAADCRPFRDEG